MKRIIVTTGLILLLLSSIIYSGDFNKTALSGKYKCRITQKNENGQIILSAKFKNFFEKPVMISYLFMTDKNGISGTSSNSQSGTETVQGNSEILLSKVSLDFNRSNNYKAYLQIFKDNVIISSDSLVVNKSR